MVKSILLHSVEWEWTMQAAWLCLPKPSHVNKQPSGTFLHSLTEKKPLRSDMCSCINEATLKGRNIQLVCVFVQEMWRSYVCLCCNKCIYFGRFPIQSICCCWASHKAENKFRLNRIPFNKKSCNLVATFSCSYMTVSQRLKPTGQRRYEYSTRLLDTQKLQSQAQTVVRTVLGSETCRDASRGQRVFWLLSSCRSFSLHQCSHTLPLY